MNNLDRITFNGVIVKTMKATNACGIDHVNTIINPITIKSLEELNGKKLDGLSDIKMIVVELNGGMPMRQAKCTIGTNGIAHITSIDKIDEAAKQNIIRKNARVIRPLISGLQITVGGPKIEIWDKIPMNEQMLVKSRVCHVENFIRWVNVTVEEKNNKQYTIDDAGNILIQILRLPVLNSTTTEYAALYKALRESTAIPTVNEVLNNMVYEAVRIVDGKIEEIYEYRLKVTHCDEAINLNLDRVNTASFKDIDAEAQDVLDTFVEDYCIGLTKYYTDKNEKKGGK